VVSRGSRRGTFWVGFSEGVNLLTLSPGTVSRLLIPSLLEAEIGRELENYTVTRIILNLHLHATGAEAVITAGVHVVHENVGVGVVKPAQDIHADWLWHEEFVAPPSADDQMAVISRDLRAQRKLNSREQELYFELNNRSGAVSVEVHRSGRVLVKRA